MDTVILTGGQGERLRSVVSDRPKTMASINGRPFLDLLLEHLQGFGLSRFLLCTGFMGDIIADHFREEPDPSRQVLISQEPKPLGTAGAVKNAEPLISGDPFLLLNGDSFCPADLTAFTRFHQAHNALVSMVLSYADDSASYGTVVLGHDDTIIDFKEKSVSGEAWINAGIYLFRREVLSHIPPGVCYSLEQDLFPRLINRNLRGYVTPAPVIDIGTPERYIKAQQLIRI